MTDWAAMHADLFELEGVDATVQRGADAPVPVRVILEEGRQVFGEYGQTVGQVRIAHFLVAQFLPAEPDVLTVGASSWAIDSVPKNDGLVAEAVLRG